MKVEYKKPRINILEIQAENALCASVVTDGATIGGVTQDEEYEW